MSNKLWDRLTRVDVVVSLGMFGGTAMTGALTWLASTVEPIVSLGWGAVILTGIGAACIVAFVITACLVGWRYYHPLPTDVGPPLSKTGMQIAAETPNAHPSVGLSASIIGVAGVVAKLSEAQDALRRRVDGIANDIEKTLSRGLQQSRQEQEAAEEKSVAVINDVKAYAKDITEANRDGTIGWLKRIEAQQSVMITRIDELQTRTFEMIAALNTGQALQDLDGQIRVLFAEMNRADTSLYASEDGWLEGYEHWKSRVEGFWSLVASWIEDVSSPFEPPIPPDEEVHAVPGIKVLVSRKAWYRYQTMLMANERHLQQKEKAFYFIKRKASPP